MGSADERRDALRRSGDVVDRGACGPEEAGAQQEVLGRVAGDHELREEGEVGALVARALDPLDDAARVAGEVADDAVDLCEREPQHVHPVWLVGIPEGP